MAHYMGVYDNITGNRLAFLENAYDIGYKLELNKLYSASFKLPADDYKNQFCQPYRYIDIWDRDEFIGLFRIVPSVQNRSEKSRVVEYTCESVLATLMDDVLFGWHEIGNVGVYTQEVLNYVLSAQTSPRWELARCDFTHQYLYGWENENLLSALFSVANPFKEDYKWDIDTSATPWKLSLLEPDTTPKQIIQYRKNLTSVKKNVDPTNICTRLYPLGYGEGVNQLNITKLNNDRYYLDAETQSQYGIVSRIWVDRRYQDEESLYDAAQAMLKELSVPYVSYDITLTQNNLTQPITIGDYVRVIDDEDGTDFLAHVVAIEKKDVKGNNPSIKVTIANKSRNVATTVADLADRQRINEVYAQGAVTVFTKTFADNADTRHPAVLKFDLPENIVHVNKINLNGNTAPFRGYSLATGGGGGTTATTAGGGAFTQTSSSGGSGTSTTSSGGQSTQTSTATTLQAQYMQSDGNSGPNTAKHNHGMPDYVDGVQAWIPIVDASGNSLGRTVFVPSGAHSHGEHSHNVSIPSHTHNFSWTHSHSVTVNDHTHNITIPNHTHEISYGIYEGDKADAMRLVVDGTDVGTYETFNDLNIIPFLDVDNGGNISRSTHTVEVYPVTEGQENAISRIELDMSIQLFANSRGGGQY